LSSGSVAIEILDSPDIFCLASYQDHSQVAAIGTSSYAPILTACQNAVIRNTRIRMLSIRSRKMDMKGRMERARNRPTH
jgi:hypothetical protein